MLFRQRHGESSSNIYSTRWVVHSELLPVAHWQRFGANRAISKRTDRVLSSGGGSHPRSGRLFITVRSSGAWILWTHSWLPARRVILPITWLGFWPLPSWRARVGATF